MLPYIAYMDPMGRIGDCHLKKTKNMPQSTCYICMPRHTHTHGSSLGSVCIIRRDKDAMGIEDGEENVHARNSVSHCFHDIGSTILSSLLVK